MPGWLFAVIVIVFLAVAILLVRRSMKGAMVERLPLADEETSAAALGALHDFSA